LAFFKSLDILYWIPVLLKGLHLIGSYPAVIRLVVRKRANHYFDIRPSVIQSAASVACPLAPRSPFPQLCSLYYVMITDMNSPGFFSMVISSHKVFFQIIGKEGIGIR